MVQLVSSLVLLTGLIMHLMCELATVKRDSNLSLQWPIHLINPVDKIKLSCITPHRRSTTVSLETYLFI